jgi:hypothetical protein
MKAIIEVSGKGSVFRAAASQVAAARKGRTPDFRLSFESARSLFAELTPARLDLLDTPRRVGPCSVYSLAKAADRNYSNVHTDASCMEELGLIADRAHWRGASLGALRIGRNTTPTGPRCRVADGAEPLGRADNPRQSVGRPSCHPSISSPAKSRPRCRRSGGWVRRIATMC